MKSLKSDKLFSCTENFTFSGFINFIVNMFNDIIDHEQDIRINRQYNPVFVSFRERIHTTTIK